MCLGFSLLLMLVILQVWKAVECGKSAYQGLCDDTA